MVINKYMKEDILEKINNLLTRHGSSSDLVLYKEDAVTLIDLLVENVEEDRVLLQALKRYVETSWNTKNDYLKESMEDVLAYYGIIEKKGIEPKMVMEKRGTYLIKKQVELKNIDHIKGILDK
jgi:hypothetical protein